MTSWGKFLAAAGTAHRMSANLHSKNSRVRFDPEKGPMGPDPFLGQTDLESG